MALPATDANSWMQSLDLPSRFFGEGGFGGSDYELYEEDDGVLNVSAEQVDESRNRRKTYHRRFRFPEEVDEDEITASYNNGVLEVTLPTIEDATARGRTIPVEG